jgi:hypothetical protein
MGWKQNKRNALSSSVAARRGFRVLETVGISSA